MTLTTISVTKNMNLRKFVAEQRIEAKAAQVRARFATPGKHTIYDKKLQEARRYVAAVDSEIPPASLAEYPYMQREIGISAATPMELAQLWIMMNDAWDQISPLIEELSIGSKGLVRAAISQAQINDIVADAVAQLDAIGEPAPTQGT